MTLLDIPLDDARCRAALYDLQPDASGRGADWRYVVTPRFTSADYVVSDHGCVVSLPRYRTYGTGPRNRRFVPGRILRPGTTASGHRTLTLSHEGTLFKTYVHHIVAWTFLGPQPPDTYILHRDGDAANNRVSNLLYSTDRRPPGSNHRTSTLLRLPASVVEAVYAAAEGTHDPVSVVTTIRDLIDAQR